MQGPQPPVIINKVCVPPSEFMIKHGDLKRIETPTLTEKQAIDQWLSDVQSYNLLNVDHSALIDWVNTHCK